MFIRRGQSKDRHRAAIRPHTHSRANRRCTVAVLDIVSRNRLATVVSAEESSLQVEVAFTDALFTDGAAHLLEDDQVQGELATGVVPERDERLPVLLAISDNGPQVTSKATTVFVAEARIAQHVGRPGLPTTGPGRVALRAAPDRASADGRHAKSLEPP